LDIFSGISHKKNTFYRPPINDPNHPVRPTTQPISAAKQAKENIRNLYNSPRNADRIKDTGKQLKARPAVDPPQSRRETITRKVTTQLSISIAGHAT